MICTRCNQPIVMHMEARYTIADSDDGEFGEHYKCHEEFVAKLKTDGDRLAGKIPEIKDTLAKIAKFFVVGWLLITYHGGTIAWYESQTTCDKAATFATQMYETKCVPDRFEFEPGGSFYEAKP